MILIAQNIRDLNSAVVSAIDETIADVLAASLITLYDKLRDQYSITRDELPYRTETLYKVLEDVFGVFGAKTLGSVIARTLYGNQGLVFENHDGYSLSDYVEFAKSKFSQS